MKKTFVFEMNDKDVFAVLDVLEIEKPYQDYNKKVQKAFKYLIKELENPAIMCTRNFPHG